MKRQIIISSPQGRRKNKKIADTENLYSFECIGIEKSNRVMYEKIYEEKPISITREDFIKIAKRNHDNPQAALDQLVRKLGALNVDEYKNYFEGRKIKYNPIELE
ncbi:MAG: hypothetical protein LBP63_03170 [Prevotellaceae bacterium]|jgi:hypothetical protein|nr:hypothetical protein [Prevotellaceae bacterium]